MAEFFEIIFVVASGYVLVAGYLSINDGDLKHVGVLGAVLLILYFPVIALYSSKLDWHLEDRALWELLKEHVEWLIAGGILAIIYINISDNYLSEWLFKNNKSNKGLSVKSYRKNMGTSSASFEDKSLNVQTIAIIRLTHLTFGHLDRQVSASVEANLNIRPNQRKNVQRLLAQVIDEKPSLAKTLRPLKRMQQGGHNAAYSIFDKVCMIAAHSQRYSQATLNNLISIAQQLGLSQEEIYYLFQKSRLAV